MKANNQSKTRKIGQLLLVVTCGLAAACSAAPAQESAATDEAKWGHLSGGELNPEAPQFLINKKPGQAFRVCLPAYMAKSFPGIESEVYAAINVWGSYLGRTVTPEIVTRDLPRATAAQDVNDVSKAYNDACGEGFDIVMGMARLDGSTVGITGFSYSFFPQPDGSKKVVSFQRYLFLRDYDLAPDRDDVGARWASVQASGGASVRGEDLLATMKTRSSTQYAQDGRYLTLPVLTHEYGHVWGLCDQYEGANNCDPVHSSSHMVLNSIMGARSGTEHLYLSDDDIEGIRALEARPEFARVQASTWGTPPALTAPPSRVTLKDVELVRITRVDHDRSGLHITYGVVTPVAAKYEFFLRSDNDTEWTPLTSDMESDTGFDAPLGRLNINLGSDMSAFTVRLTVSTKNADGTYTERQSQELRQAQ